MPALVTLLLINEEREEEKRNSASVKIQMMTRQRMAKQRVFSLREGYKRAVLIQCKWRQALAQKSMRRRICGRNESAAIKIQSCVRKVIAQRKRLYLRNVVLVQSCCQSLAAMGLECCCAASTCWLISSLG